MGIEISHALLGQLVLFGVFAIIIYAMAREAARLVIRGLFVVGLILAVAIMAGWLDNSVVGQLLEKIGDVLIVGIKAVVRWVMEAWEQVSKN